MRSGPATSARRRVTVLGVTGSIGASTADVIAAEPERFEVLAVAAGSNARLLAERAVQIGARRAIVADPAQYQALGEALAGTGVEAAAGEAAVCEAATMPADVVVAAIVGVAGLRSTLSAVRAGNTVALANKESLVTAGPLVTSEARRSGARLLPLDSEHNAVFQALVGIPADAIERVTLTASGGPFRTRTRSEMARMTPADALRHPNWSMGAKITIDSATLMNKGLELIEAHHLFGLAPERLDVLVHPQSVVHGLVVCRDGSVLAQLSAPDMRIPIGYCLFFPERRPMAPVHVDLARLGALTFERPDPDRFPALRLAEAAMRDGGAAPIVLNAANEIAVAAFIAGEIGFLDIAALVERTLSTSLGRGLGTPATLDDVLAIDAAARALAREAVPLLAANES